MSATQAEPLIATLEECLIILTQSARATVADFIDDDGEPMKPSKMRYPHALQEYNIRSVSRGESNVKVKPYDKIRAIQELAERLDWKAGAIERAPVNFIFAHPDATIILES